MKENILSYNNSYFYHYSFILITLHLRKNEKEMDWEIGKHITLYKNHLTVNPTFYGVCIV